MLYVIASAQTDERKAHIAALIDANPEGEYLVFDDAMMTLEELEQFLYPSLFSLATPVVHGKYFLDRFTPDDSFIKKLVASPTVFIFEEFSISKPLATTLTKHGALLTTSKEEKKKKENDPFAVTACITAKDKKSRWIAYRSALESQPVEAFLGILYWKLRTLASGLPSGNQYEKMYRAFLGAQMRAWRTGAPLDALIEKIILES